MIEIKPMDESYLHLCCLHHGPVETTSFKPAPDQLPDALPPHPWSDETLRQLAAVHKAITHPGPKEHCREFIREMMQRYGTCAILAWEGQKVVGHLRFFPMKVARLMAVSQTDPSPVLDCTAACAPEEDEGTLWVQCVMTCRPYVTSDDAKKANARKGTGLKLVQALISWARKHGWKRIVKVAHCDLDWFYGIQGGGGKAFWEKAGFDVVGSFHKRAFGFSDQHKAIVQSQMTEKGMTEQEVWTWYRVSYEL